MLELIPFSARHLAMTERWFDDPDTQRWLGGSGWAAQSLRLADPAKGRHVLLAVIEGVPVGMLDVEIEGASASFALVVATTLRRQGLGAQILGAMFIHSAFANIKRFWGGVEAGNQASERLLARCRFTRASRQTDSGFTDFEFRR